MATPVIWPGPNAWRKSKAIRREGPVKEKRRKAPRRALRRV
jgi:hypothetical protein